jgi:hypothetical protein
MVGNLRVVITAVQYVFQSLVLQKIHAEGKGLYKGKANGAQTWTGPEGSSKLRLPEFLHIWHMKVVSLLVLHNGCLNPPGDDPGTNFCQMLGRP